MAEYENLIMGRTIQLKPGFENRSGEDLGKEVATELGKLVSGLGNIMRSPDFSEGPGWELMSHEITRLGSHLLVTFLLRRQTK